MGETAGQDTGPFFHGTSAEKSPGELFSPGHPSNYRPEVLMNHIYFTALVDGAGMAADIAALRGGTAHVYEVEPTGDYDDDPNVTDKMFPGNPTRSYRSDAPVRVVREIHDWKRLTAEQLETWRERLANPMGEIIN